MTKCNVCEVSDEQKEILIREFSNEIFPIIQKYLEKIPEPALAAYLIHYAKELMCSWGEDNYYLTLGLLTDMVQDDLQEIFERSKNPEEEKN